MIRQAISGHGKRKNVCSRWQRPLQHVMVSLCKTAQVDGYLAETIHLQKIREVNTKKTSHAMPYRENPSYSVYSSTVVVSLKQTYRIAAVPLVSRPEIDHCTCPGTFLPYRNDSLFSIRCIVPAVHGTVNQKSPSAILSFDASSSSCDL